MPNVTIPTTSTTQTLTGDNGFTTEATFTANALQSAFFGRTGVGLAGSDYDPFGESALDVSFSDAVEDVQFTLFDVDQRVGSWDDQVRVEAFDLAGNPIPIRSPQPVVVISQSKMALAESFRSKRLTRPLTINLPSLSALRAPSGPSASITRTAIPKRTTTA